MFCQLIKNITSVRAYADNENLNALQALLLQAVSDPLLFFVISVLAILWSHLEMPFNTCVASIPNSKFTPEFCGSLLRLLLDVYKEPVLLLDHQFVPARLYNKFPKFRDQMEAVRKRTFSCICLCFEFRA